MAKNRNPILDHLFIYIGDKAIPLSLMGKSADLPLNQGLQQIIDDGLLGPEYIGMSWYEVIKPSGLRLDEPPNSDDELLCSLRQRWKEAELECQNALVRNIVDPGLMEKVVELKKNYDMAKKLSRQS